MPRVDFYVLAGSDPHERLLFACRLAEKAFGRGHRLFVRAADAAQAAALDELLWTFRKGSFVPHRLHCAAGPTAPVLIGTGAAPAEHREVLINLAPTLPEAFEHCARIAEPIDQSPAVLGASRERFRAYREHGCALETHRL